MQTGTVSTRDTYWDVAKGLLMFLVILGHVIQHFMYQGGNSLHFWSDPLFKGIYLFHMPLFMFMSGYFADKSVTKYSWLSIPRYFQRLALPCIGMGIIYLLISALQGDDPIKFFLKGGALLWFLIVVFECVIWYIIMQLRKNWWYKVLIFFIPIHLAVYFSTNPVLSMCWPHHSQFTYLWPIFVLGASLSSSHFTQNAINRRWSYFILLFIPLYFIFQPTWYVYISPLKYNFSSILINLFRTLTAITACGGFLWLVKCLHPYLGKYSIIKSIGQATLGLYALQALFFVKYEHIVSYLPNNISYRFSLLLSLILLLLFYIIYSMTRRIPIISLLMYGEKRTPR